MTISQYNMTLSSIIIGFNCQMLFLPRLQLVRVGMHKPKLLALYAPFVHPFIHPSICMLAMCANIVYTRVSVQLGIVKFEIDVGLYTCTYAHLHAYKIGRAHV